MAKLALHEALQDRPDQHAWRFGTDEQSVRLGAEYPEKDEDHEGLHHRSPHSRSRAAAPRFRWRNSMHMAPLN